VLKNGEAIPKTTRKTPQIRKILSHKGASFTTLFCALRPFKKSKAGRVCFFGGGGMIFEINKINGKDISATNANG
jgi:hypothetical protein